RYREGDAYEEEYPGRVVEGEVLARRVLVIEDGMLTRILAEGLVLSRRPGGWEAQSGDELALGPGGAGQAARPGALGVGVGAHGEPRSPDVTANLDAEQTAAVFAPPSRPLLVLGSAGSGKTTVALHRLARLGGLAAGADLGVVVPEEGLARLSRRLLAPLGASQARVETLDAWAESSVRDVFGRGARLCFDAPASVIALKRHPALYAALRERYGGVKMRHATLRGLWQQVLADAMTDRAFLRGVVDASGGLLTGRAVEDTVRHTLLQLATPVAEELGDMADPSRAEAIDGRAVWEDTPDDLANTVDIEDLPILLFLRAWRGKKPMRRYTHLVLDEAEDFSLFELFVLAAQRRKEGSVTLAGDEAQQTSSSFVDWDTTLATLGLHDAALCRLSTSYRCPRPITDLAREILGDAAPEKVTRAAREGTPVGRFLFPTQAQAQLFVAGALRDVMAREPRASV
ncbi:MAG TPA: UvrD-helicase domain-containing protein, partial [Myxococcota bacterium]|nr:UvrD-helicase domain-containing protein [Myxococcota bacterium]